MDCSISEMNLNETLKTIKILPNHIPIMLWGSPGIGKTKGLHYTFEPMGYRLIPVLAGCSEPTDLSGIPFNYQDLYAKYLVPGWAFLCSDHDQVPKDYRGPAILFLDDIVTAPEQTQAAFFKLVHERRLGELGLRDNVRIIAAGNRVEDKSAASRMPLALANRFFHIHVKHDYRVWLEWARVNNIHPNIIAFIRVQPNYLSTFEDAIKKGYYAFATPRSWEMLSDSLHALDAANMRKWKGKADASNDQKSAENYTFRVASGIIGQGLAAVFNTFIRNTMTLIAPEEIIADPKKARIPKNEDIDILHATVSAAEHFIKKKDNSKHWQAFMTYALRILPDLGLILAKQCVSVVLNDLTDEDRIKAAASPEFSEMFTKWGDHLTVEMV